MVLRSVTELPRALLEVSPDPLWGDDDNNNNNNNNPACIINPLHSSPPGWFVNPFGQPLTLILIYQSEGEGPGTDYLSSWVRGGVDLGGLCPQTPP